jgi:N-acetylmuramoyl-L-alanine amidase
MKKGIFISFNLKSFLSIILVFIIAFFVALSVDIASVKTTSLMVDMGQVVIVDAGHGGEDGGTQSSAGVLEKDLNLDISLKLGNLLKLMGYTVVYTRTEDVLHYGGDAVKQRQKKISDIHYRMQIAENYPDAIFLSIHQNYFTESKYSGAQVFYSKNNAYSKDIAQSIQTNIKELVQPENDRQIKLSGTDIYLLYNAKLPAVMVECGFLSNAGEALRLSDSEYQKKLTLAIVAGIEEFQK